MKKLSVCVLNRHVRKRFRGHPIFPPVKRKEAKAKCTNITGLVGAVFLGHTGANVF